MPSVSEKSRFEVQRTQKRPVKGRFHFLAERGSAQLEFLLVSGRFMLIKRYL